MYLLYYVRSVLCDLWEYTVMKFAANLTLKGHQFFLTHPVDNIMTCVFKSTVLNCKYFGGFCMNFFQTRIYCTKFCVLPFSYLS